MPRLAALVLALLCLLVTDPARAHKSSDAYLQIDTGPRTVAVRWDIALRDLDAALDLDADADGRLTWGEVRTAWPRIEAYALPRLAIDGCAWRAGTPALERRSDGAYAVLRLDADCTPGSPPRIGYSLFAEIDPTHRGIARLGGAGAAASVLLLDPTASPVFPPSATASAPSSSGTTGPWTFIAEGVEHILTGYDHVLFLLCLLLPAVRRRPADGGEPVTRLSQAVWPVLGIVTAFTVAHSITLGLAALKVVSLPSSFIEPAIAATIVLAAIDNLRPVFPVPRVVVAFAFGLIHGFGFAGVLGELDLPAADFAWALLQFNLGLELGQVAIVAAVTALLFAVRRWRLYRRVVVQGGSVLAAAIAGAWFVERTANVSLLPF